MQYIGNLHSLRAIKLALVVPDQQPGEPACMYLTKDFGNNHSFESELCKPLQLTGTSEHAIPAIDWRVVLVNNLCSAWTSDPVLQGPETTPWVTYCL